MSHPLFYFSNINIKIGVVEHIYFSIINIHITYHIAVHVSTFPISAFKIKCGRTKTNTINITHLILSFVIKY